MGHNVLIDMSELLAQKDERKLLPRPTLRGIAFEDPMISFGDNEESLNTRIWL